MVTVATAVVVRVAALVAAPAVVMVAWEVCLLGEVLVVIMEAAVWEAAAALEEKGMVVAMAVALLALAAAMAPPLR